MAPLPRDRPRRNAGIHQQHSGGPLHDLPVGTGSVSVASYTGNYSNGEPSAWLFEYSNASGRALLAIQVVGGVATEIGVAVGSGCSLPLSTFHPLPSGVVDSAQVATTLLGDPDVEEFLHNYTTANASFALVNPSTGTSRPPSAFWTVQYTACGLLDLSSPVSSHATGGSVLVAVNATLGTIISTAYQPPTASCAGGTMLIPIGTAFASGNPVLGQCPSGDTYSLDGCQAGDYTYTLTIEASSVTLSSVLFEVTTATGGGDTLASDGGFSILNITNGVVAQSSPSLTLHMVDPWNTYNAPAGPATSLTPLDTIEVDVGTSNPTGTGLSFVVLGTGAYTGTTTTSLP